MILDEIATYTKERINIAKEKISPEEMKKRAYDKEISDDFRFYKALSKQELSYICEVKKASPSKGIIAEHFPYVEIAKAYEKAGADAISCLTEPKYFLGSNEYLEDISREVNIPILRKDFVVDSYMIYEARAIGASAVLLICSILSDSQLEEYYQIANELKLSALFEAHDEEEIERAMRAGAKIIGVNNRNLKNFKVDINNSKNLREKVPGDILFVSESGVSGREDIIKLEENNTNAVLIGEYMMKSDDKSATLRYLKGAGE